MDRRSFLKVSGTAAVAGVAGAAAGEARPSVTPRATVATLRPDARVLAITVAGSGMLPGAAESLVRIGHRLALASGGTLSVVAAAAATSADGLMSPIDDDVVADPAHAFFGGLPGPSAPAPDRLQAWLRSGGGQMLWDDLAAGQGWKPLWASHKGAAGALWLPRGMTLETWQGARVGAAGLLGEAVARLGAVPVAWDQAETAEWTALDAVHVDGPLALATGLCGLSKAVVPGGLQAAGTAIVLRIRREVWDGLSSAEQLLVQMAAADEVQSVLAEQMAHAGVALSVARQVGVAEVGLPAGLRASLQSATAEVITAVGESDEMARRIAASYRAFTGARSWLDALS